MQQKQHKTVDQLINEQLNEQKLSKLMYSGYKTPMKRVKV